MSLVYDVASAVKTIDASSGGSVSWTHTPTGTPKVATVNLQWTSDINDLGIMSIASVTYGGTAMTQVSTQVITGGHNQEKYILVSPATGAQTVTVTWTDDGFPTDTATGRATSTTFTATNTPTYGTIQKATGTASPITKAVSGVASTSTLDTIGGVSDGSSAAITITVNGTGETKSSGVTTYGNGTTISRGQFYTSTQTGTGTVTANATESASRNWGIMVLEILEGAGGDPFPYVGGGYYPTEG